MKEIDSCPFEEPVGDYKIAPGEKKKTRFEKITESPTALAMFLDQAVFQRQRNGRTGSDVLPV